MNYWDANKSHLIILRKQGFIAVFIDYKECINHPHSYLVCVYKPDVGHLEIKNLRSALEKTGGKIFGEHGESSLIGIPPTTFCSKIKKYGIPNK